MKALRRRCGVDVRAQILGGGTCGTKPCWRALGTTGFRYVDKKALREGVQKLVFKAGKAKIVVKGKGTRLREKSLTATLLPLTPPVVVQLVSSTGTCWEASYDAGVSTSTTQTFVARGD